MGLVHHLLHSLGDLLKACRTSVRPTVMCRLVVAPPQLYCNPERSTHAAVVKAAPRADLAHRRQVSRDKATNIGRAMSNISSAVIFGGIFWRMGASQSSIQDRMGLLQACNTLLSPCTMHKSTLTLRTEPCGVATLDCWTHELQAKSLLMMG